VAVSPARRAVSRRTALKKGREAAIGRGGGSASAASAADLDESRLRLSLRS